MRKLDAQESKDIRGVTSVMAKCFFFSVWVLTMEKIQEPLGGNSVGTLGFLGHRLQTSMTWRIARQVWAQPTLREGRLLVCG